MMCKSSLPILFLFAAISTNAAPVVHGTLSSDSGGTVITDTVTLREYLRFDEFNLSYEETLIAVAPGGIYEGWTIANRVVVEAFIDSLLGGATSCNGLGFENICGTVSGWSDGDFGDNSQLTDDIVAFLSDAGIKPLGIHAIRDDGVVFQYESWGDADNLDFWGQVATQPINLLLYRDVDSDGDGLLNPEDNCPSIQNPLQEPSVIEPGRGVVCEGLPPGC